MPDSREIQVGDVKVAIADAPEIKFPSDADSNSPCWWAQDGRFHLLTSTGHPRQSAGENVENLLRGEEITFTAWRDGGRWIESVHQKADGTLYGWYHNEPAHFIPEEYQQGRQFPMTAPFIGAAVSYDNGNTWDDLGLVLSGDADSLNLENRNYWFAGGNGDFSVVLDRDKQYFYFLFGTYYRDVAQQGIALARMRYADLACPVGRVQKWHGEDWREPGLRGSVAPVVPVRADWYGPTPDAFWGPSVHWNTHTQRYVILMNRAIDPQWKQDGIYVSIAKDISDPGSWSDPVRLLAGTGWYPQVIGLDFTRRETDREAGAWARLFIHGVSNYTVRFSLV